MVVIFLVNGYAGITEGILFQNEAIEAFVDGNPDDSDARGHDLVSACVLEFQGIRDELALGFVDDSFVFDVVHHRLEFLV